MTNATKRSRSDRGSCGARTVGPKRLLERVAEEGDHERLRRAAARSVGEHHCAPPRVSRSGPRFVHTLCGVLCGVVRSCCAITVQ
jgi:hypothetical protein